MIGLIVALNSEIKTFFKQIKKKVYQINNIDFYLCTHQNIEFVLVFTDVGKTNASFITGLLINNFKPKVILNVGSCGALNDQLKVLDIAIIDQCQYLDVNVSAFGYLKNQIPRLDKFFILDKNYNQQIKNQLIKKKLKCWIANVGSSDTFINRDNISFFYDQQIDLVDMELAAIAHVCTRMLTPLVSIKLVSDHITLPNPNQEQFNKNLLLIDKWFNEHLTSIIEAILEIY
ncbi:5'-methylthioadenosine/S-adenosylhomocysteine nucleosidase [Ureaplasma parvum]|uniref:5'-methylthioadenosine/S-adenosylhomocysteine nucleosidase n=1 Tax=Ureaplasma parvum TaxID=134821 RepID=UPI0026F2FDC2|nr:5'-methylthioadenosine/S-adenosylhomocysteine nucleosidase [Ureaplasma parvum]